MKVENQLKNIQEKRNWVLKIFENLKNVKTINELRNLEINSEIEEKDRMKTDNLHKIQFSISPDEINNLIQDGMINLDFSFNQDISRCLNDTITKLLFAIAWKNGDLNKIKHIVNGIYNSKKDINTDFGSSIVFQQFGRFIANQNDNPIIDQHVIRAYLAFKAQNVEEFIKAQKLKAVTNKHLEIVIEYINWLKSGFFEIELKNNPEFNYYVDKLLYGVGKTIKIKSKS